MVTLDYVLDPEELARVRAFDFAELSGTHLDYRLFCGSILFRVNAASFDAPWKWIPIFDFCVRLNEVLLKLNTERQAVLEFTENDATISFRRVDGLVTITADYADGSAHAGLQELRDAVKGFSARLIHDLTKRWPVLLAKSAFHERLDIIRSASGEVLPA
jgi:hypothetical protein